MINLEPFDLIGPDSASEMIKQAREQARCKMDKLLGEPRLHADRYETVIAEGAVAGVLLEILRRNQIDMVVLGTHGRCTFKKLFLGSIAEEVFRTAPCPVLTVGPRVARPPAVAELRHVLYAVEFAPDSSDAGNFAVSLAEQYRAQLTMMNVREDMPSASNKTEQITEPAERWLEDHVPPGSDLRQRFRLEQGFGPAGAAILGFAAQAAVDVIVMPVRRLDPVMAAHLPKADTAYEVVSRAPCPVLTIR